MVRRPLARVTLPGSRPFSQVTHSPAREVAVHAPATTEALSQLHTRGPAAPSVSSGAVLTACPISWRSPIVVLTLLVALAAYGAIVLGLLAANDYNPSVAAHIGDQFDGRRFWTPTTHVERGIGYDGQFFFYLAHDPLLRVDDPEAFLDRPAYRAARILYPALAWAASLGHPEAIPWALLAINLVAAALGTVAAVDVLRSLGARPWLALVFGFSPAVLIGLIADLSEPTALALVAGGVALFLRGRHRGAGLTLAFATLAREASALVPLGFALHAVARRSWRQAVEYLLPLLLPLAWHLWLWLRLGALPAAQSPTNFGPPLSGPLYRAGLLLGLQPPLFGEPPTEAPFSELVVIACSVAVMLVGLLKILRRRDVFAVQLWLQATAALFTTPLVWIGLGSYARVLGLLYLVYGLVLLTGKRAAETPTDPST